MHTINLVGKAYIMYKLITKLLYCQKQSFAAAAATLLKRDSKHRCFKNTFFKKHILWLLLYCRNYSTRKHNRKKRKETQLQQGFSLLSRISKSSRSQFKNIPIFTRTQYLFSSFSCEKFEKTSLLLKYRNQVILYFHLLLKSKNVSKSINFTHFSLRWDDEQK